MFLLLIKGYALSKKFILSEVQIMNKKSYEVMAISAPMQEAIDTTRQILTNVIDQFGTLKKTDEWGEKRLAYRIGDYEKGYYFLFTFESTSEGIKELDRKARNSEQILRHMIISKC